MLAIFVALFATADAVFATALERTLDLRLDLDDVPARLAVVALIGWAAASALALVAIGHTALRGAREVRIPVRWGGAESTVLLVAVDVVFIVFVALQATYLFGGRDTLAETGLSYSGYARRGFVELVVVIVLVGGLLLMLESVVRDRGRAFVARP